MLKMGSCYELLIRINDLWVLVLDIFMYFGGPKVSTERMEATILLKFTLFFSSLQSAVVVKKAMKVIMKRCHAKEAVS